ncbi:KRI1-like family C-terminal-domain-containing protein [Kalaharituber pfeilii]|nr:KRI1-like family C-terminal-domain-containing protein [Kalaharituber pfeilii]
MPPSIPKGAKIIAEQHTQTQLAAPDKKALLGLDNDDDDDDVDSSAGEVELRINEEYARRFEHNKKREELQRLEEKYKKNRKKRQQSASESSGSTSSGDDSVNDESSTSEEEDEYGVFADEVADEDILATIQAIRSKDPRIYDRQTRFFKALSEDRDDDSKEAKEAEKEKPMFLKDYHRMNLLNGIVGTDGGEQEAKEQIAKPKTYFEQQEELKRDLVRDMHNAAKEITQEGGDDDDDDFLKAKNIQPENIPPPPDPVTADPNDPDSYLKAFLASKAWLPKDRMGVYGSVLESDDSEEEEVAEQFEQGFNLRFEDPSKAAQLVGHARGAVKMMSARREAMSARKRAREAKQKQKEEEKRRRDIEKGRLRALKIEELMNKVKQIKQVAGLNNNEDDSKDWKKLLDGGWSDEKWDEAMQKKFGEEYYALEEGNVPEKPTWEDDIDIGDIEVDNDNDDGIGGVGDEANVDEVDDAGNGKLAKWKITKDSERERREQKKRDRETRKEIEKYVDESIDFDEQVSSGNTKGFRYREVTPETFGLTPLDILAADDAQLNSYAGLKRYATFRPPERKKQDKRKYSKKRRLREWRKEVFGDEDGPQLPLQDKKQADDTQRKIAEAGNKIEVDSGERKKKRRKRR